MPDLSAAVASPAQVNVSVGSVVSEVSVSVGTPISSGVAAHAYTHAAEGPDPLSPSSIGALSAGEGIAYAIALG